MHIIARHNESLTNSQINEFLKAKRTFITEFLVRSGLSEARGAVDERRADGSDAKG